MSSLTLKYYYIVYYIYIYIFIAISVDDYDEFRPKE